MHFDAVVVGSGPNGLAAAIELRRAGCSVAVYEGRPTVGGGARSAELTLPGFLHDVCSAIHPLALSSPFFKTLPLQELGIEWIQPDFPLAHTLDDGDAVILDRSLSVTAEQLGSDSRRYVQVFERFIRQRDTLMTEILAPPHIPRHPFLLAAFARHGLRSAQSFAYSNFSGERARALFAGIAGHSALALDSRPGAAFGLVLSILGHSVGWPIPKGGSQQIANGLAAYFTGLGGRIFTGTPIASLSDLPSSKIVLCDVTPRQLIQLAPERARSAFTGKWRRYRHGPGACKVDWALHSPIPWKSLHCRKAGTIHIGGSFQEIAAAEQAPARGQLPERPFIILTQPSLFDGTRAPAGRHTAWAYCHVPNGSYFDMTERIEARIESVAPGFRDCIMGRHTMSAEQLETYNPNYVGGDINGGIQDLRQLFTRPVSAAHPYHTPIRGVYICSSSTPPGGAVHGMCGRHAARAALEDLGIGAYNADNP